MIAELAINLLNKVHHEVELQPLKQEVGSPEAESGSGMKGALSPPLSTAAPLFSQEIDAVHAETLPPPMIPDNHESISDKCFIGKKFTETVRGWRRRGGREGFH
jgi:hypothetical protein